MTWRHLGTPPAGAKARPARVGAEPDHLARDSPGSNGSSRYPEAVSSPNEMSREAPAAPSSSLASQRLQPLTEGALPGEVAVVVAPGVHQLDIDHSRIPADAAIFRAGAFSAEDSYWFGREVTAWFTDDLPDSFVDGELTRGDYRIGAVVLDGRRRRTGPTPLTPHGPVRWLDWTPLLARDSDLARVLMAEVRPSITWIMAAVALAAGYQQVLVIDSQLDSISRGRTFLVGAPRTDQPPAALDEAPASRIGHGGLDRRNLDLGLLARFKARGDAILDASTTGTLGVLVERAPVLDVADSLAPLPKAPLLSPGSSAQAYVERTVDGISQRCAFVTVCDSPDYLWGVRALANSLAEYSDVPLILLASPKLDTRGLRFAHDNVRILRTTALASPKLSRQHQARFLTTYTKLAVFGLSFLDRMVYLDADTIVLGEVDHLFDHERMAAAPDIGIHIEHQSFNSGVFACRPSSRLFADMVDKVPQLESYDGGDQGFLNAYFGDEIEWLPLGINTLRRAASRYPDVAELEQTSVLHYVGDKPWQVQPDSSWTALDRLWFGHLSEQEKIDFLLWQRRQFSAQQDNGKLSRAQRLMRLPNEGLSHMAERALNGQDPKAAIAIAQQSIRQRPDSPGTRRTLSKALLADGQYIKAAGNEAYNFSLRVKRTLRRQLRRLR
ncbi:glycosyltransferase family 8 protein [Parenemella sanctibonifatiensis]|nr:glycosyltransferase family 8 protein [Parenemella sanctibonifatiensis]